MTDRRVFLKTSVIAASVMALGANRTAFASTAPQDSSAPPSLSTPPHAGIVYSKDQPGQWAQKVGSHAPKVTVEGGKVAVVTTHGMTAAHYIVRHSVVLADGTVVGAKTFAATDKPESTFALPADYKGKVYATSFCNKHDLWLTEFTV